MNTMKRMLSLLLALAMTMVLVACGGSNGDSDENDITTLAGAYDITMWVPEGNSVVELTQQQIDAFEEAYPGIVINATVEGVPEDYVEYKILSKVVYSPDIFCFTQNQLDRLVQAAALSAPDKTAAEAIRNNNDASAVAAASVGGRLYAYPMTSHDGYYMYYDTRVISEEDAESVEAILKACEAKGKKFRIALDNAWYISSFFFGTGCHSNWVLNEDGAFIDIDDDFHSEAGLLAMQGMQQLMQSRAYDSNVDTFDNAGVVVTGLWNHDAAVAHFGAYLGATDLPSFEVDGQSYHLGSFTSNRLLGVKPQSDAKKSAVLSLLAQYLTGEDCQQQRYEKFQWLPSNKNAQAFDAVQSHVGMAALAKQSAFGVPQGQIHSDWWNIAKDLGVTAKTAKDTDALTVALENYATALDALFQVADEQENASTPPVEDTNTADEEDTADATSLSVAWEMTGFVVKKDGTLVDTFPMAVNGTIVKEQDESYLRLNVALPNQFRYQFATIDDGNGDICMQDYRAQWPNDFVTNSYTYDKTLNDLAFASWAVNTDKEYFIAYWDDAFGRYLVAATNPTATPADIMAHFEHFVECY